ncbi:hypothetical protein HY213_04265 [Candidatus Peregrinibacteria bacterium]|nr:hypothetical protein [Candidatus Peregrinibacteria bacterium]
MSTVTAMESMIGSPLAYNQETFLENRRKFSQEELTKYMGRWVAWSPDEKSIVASVPSSGGLEQLDELVRAAGEDPEDCTIEGIPSDSVDIPLHEDTREILHRIDEVS